jgi:hypothetical protein
MDEPLPRRLRRYAEGNEYRDWEQAKWKDLVIDTCT